MWLMNWMPFWLIRIFSEYGLWIVIGLGVPFAWVIKDLVRGELDKWPEWLTVPLIVYVALAGVYFYTYAHGGFHIDETLFPDYYYVGRVKNGEATGKGRLFDKEDFHLVYSGDMSELPEPPVETLPEEERVLSSANATADGGRVLRVDAIGFALLDSYAVIEVRIYADGTLLQTIRVADLPPEPRDDADATRAATLEDALSVHDMNFDGADDLDLCAWWVPNDADPHYYFLWNADAETYRYAYTLKGAEANPETGEVVASYRLDSAIDCVDHYRYAEDGALELVRRVTEDWKRGTEDFPLVEYYDVVDGEPVLTRQEFTDYNDEGLTVREVREPLEGVGLWPVRLEVLELTDDGFRVARTEELPLPEPETPEEEAEAELETETSGEEEASNETEIDVGP